MLTDDFSIEDGVLKKYYGDESRVIIPDGITLIDSFAFSSKTSLTSVVIPDGVSLIDEFAFSDCVKLAEINLPDSLTIIGENAFRGCKSLTSITIPESVTAIRENAFMNCTALTSVILPAGLAFLGESAFMQNSSLTSVIMQSGPRSTGARAFKMCTALTSVSLPDSLLEIDEGTFEGCRSLNAVVIPEGVRIIKERAFSGCGGLVSVPIPASVTAIGEGAFLNCAGLTSMDIPDSVNEIDGMAFMNCKGLTSVRLPDSITVIADSAFASCTGLSSVTIPGSVIKIESRAFYECTGLIHSVIPDSVTCIDSDSFDRCPHNTLICRENSYVHQYCLDNNLSYIFDYQFAAFNGTLPPGIEKLPSPFLADEEKPFIFISYSHKDRDVILSIISDLYESGWKIWYDEGLTIGDKYDETLETHVRDCSAFLLFVTENSLNSLYVEENEIPWAVRYGKPIIRCILDESLDYGNFGSQAFATVAPSEIDRTLEKISELTRGEQRTARGISVIVNPADRNDPDRNGYAYTLYSGQNAAVAQAVILEAKNSGCTFYDAVTDGENDELLQNSASLVIFLDKPFLSDQHLTDLLIREYRAGRDLVVCLLENIEDEDLPPDLVSLHKMQWLNYVHGITVDMNTKLARHLQKRGCRNTAALPGFEYEKTDQGIVIKRYIGIDPNPKIECTYNGIPVIEIAEAAFKNAVRLKSFEVPESVRKIGKEAFMGCVSLTSVRIPDSVLEIGFGAFRGCFALSSVMIPPGIVKIEPYTFSECRDLVSVSIPDTVSEIGIYAFSHCENLASITFPDGISVLSSGLFDGCANLASFMIPETCVYAYRPPPISAVMMTLPVLLRA